MADGDGVFAVNGEFGDVFGDGVVESELAAFPKLGDADGGDGFGGGEPEHEGFGGHFDAGGGFAEGDVEDDFVVDGGVGLGTDVEAVDDALGEVAEKGVGGGHEGILRYWRGMARAHAGA